MPRTLAIDWDDHELRIVLANIQNDSVMIEGTATSELADDESKDALRLATRIKEAISSHRLKASDAIVAVNRADVELRSVGVPPVPASELPDIVRFQSLKEFSEISEEWPVDFLPLKSDENETTVTAATMSPERVALAQQALDGADLKTTGLVLRPTATVTLVDHLSPQEVVLVVDAFQLGAELSVMHGRDIQLMRTVHLPREESAWDAALSREIRRTLGAAQNQCHLKINRVVLFGSKHERADLTNRLAAELNLKVDLIDPFEKVKLAKTVNSNDIKQPGRFAGAIGVLIDHAGDDHQTIDFLNPRQPPEAPSRNRLFTVLACAAGIVLLAGLAMLWWKVSNMDSQITMLNKKKQSMKAAVDSARARVDEVASIQSWLDSDVVWLDELYRLSTELPDAEQLKLRRIQGTIIQSGNGVLDLNGISVGNESVAEMENRLGGDKRRVRGDEVTLENKDPRYPLRFKEIVTLENASSNKKSTSGSKTNTRRRAITPRRSS